MNQDQGGLWETRPDDVSEDVIHELLAELEDIETGEDLLKLFAGPTSHRGLSATRGRDDRLQREVSLERLAPDATDEERASFTRETRLAGQFAHPGIAPVYSVFLDAKGGMCRTGPVLRGRTLAELVTASRAESRSSHGSQGLREWTLTRLVQVVQRVCDTLAFAHRRSVTHGHLSTETVLVGEFGEVWVTNWRHASVGTRIEPRADLRAVGTMLGELIRDRAAPAPLTAIAETAQSATANYAGMTDIARDVSAFLEQRVATAWGSGAFAELSMWVHRHRAACTWMIALVGSLVLGAFVIYEVERHGRSEIATAEQEARTALADLRRLADTRQLAQMIEEEKSLWPAVPEKAPAFHGWIRRAERLCARRGRHETRLARLRGGGQLAPASDEAWECGVLEELLTREKQIRELLPAVRDRLSFASRLEASTITGAIATRWAEARDDIATLPAYRGLKLAPQRGLVPLRRDPRSGLWLFAHVATGDQPLKTAAENAAPEVTERTGIVLVLLPGGPARIGSYPVSAERPRGAPHVDPWHNSREAGVHTIALEPFFLSRFEVTQSQWERLRIPDRSHNRGPLLPVENVSWDTAAEFCRRADLQLPTEAQWEYACRAGSARVYWFGDDPKGLTRRGNVASVEVGAPPFESWKDGSHATARVGHYEANAFGLFDMHGNVREWCRDWFDLYEHPARAGDGLRGTRAAPYALRVVRGGSWARPANQARSASRGASHGGHRDTDLGLRPSRRVRE